MSYILFNNVKLGLLRISYLGLRSHTGLGLCALFSMATKNSCGGRPVYEAGLSQCGLNCAPALAKCVVLPPLRIFV